jgi:ABC-type phosphate/phosphonate transport system permease subunit
VISLGAVAGGGYVSSGRGDSVHGGSYGAAIPVAVELVSFRIGDKFFRKIRLCQQFVSQFIHPGDHACIYVYKQLGITDVIIGVKSEQFPSYAISFRRMVLMLVSQYLFGCLFGIIPAMILFGWLSPTLALLAMLVLPTRGAWTLWRAFQEIRNDFV